MEPKIFEYRRVDEQFIKFPIYCTLYYDPSLPCYSTNEVQDYRALYSSEEKLFGPGLPKELLGQEINVDPGRFILDLWVNKDKTFNVITLIDPLVEDSPHATRYNQLMNLTDHFNSPFIINSRETLVEKIDKCKKQGASILFTPLTAKYSDNSCFLFK